VLAETAPRLAERRAYERAVPCVERRPLGECYEDGTFVTRSRSSNRHGDARTMDLHLVPPRSDRGRAEPVVARVLESDYDEAVPSPLPAQEVRARRWRGRVTTVTLDRRLVETVDNPAFRVSSRLVTGAGLLGGGLVLTAAAGWLLRRNSRRPAYVTHPGGAGWRR
jgi:hypothetical protein